MRSKSILAGFLTGVLGLLLLGATTRQPTAAVKTFLDTPSSANLRSLVSDETGSGGSLVFATSPALTTPDLGTPTAVNLSNATSMAANGLPGSHSQSPMRYLTGRFYCGIGVPNTVTSTVANGYYIMTPFFCRESFSPSEIGCNITAAGTATAVRMWIMDTVSEDDAYPNALVANSDSGSIAVSGAAAYTAAITCTLSKGRWYHLCIMANGNATFTAIYDYAGHWHRFWGSAAGASGGNQLPWVARSYASGPPATFVFGDVTFIATTAAPQVWLEK